MSIRKKDIPMLFSPEEIHDRVEALAHEIAGTLPPDIFIVALLKGSFMFTADLVRALHEIGAQPQLDFMTISSYGAGMQSSSSMTIHRDLAEDVAGRDVLLLDDILESGRTLTFARNLLMERGASSVKVMVLLEKPGKRDLAITADYVGFTVADKFVVGYGLDYANHYRELPYIGFIDIH